MSEAPPTDVARHDVNMDGVYFCRASADGPFVGALDPGAVSYCVMVRRGQLRFETDFPVTMHVELGPGDIVAVSGLTPHVLRTHDTARDAAPMAFERRPMEQRSGRGDIDLVLGVAPVEAIALGSLMTGPILVRATEHPDVSRRLWGAVDMLEDEYAATSWIDRNLVVRRIAEVMLINISRRVFETHRAAGADARGAPAGPALLQAINAFFRAPERPWTLPDLARAGGMSRTRFAEEFKLFTGHTPGRIIARMRLTAVARRLAAEALSVEAAADAAGYSSAAAFVRAFQREFGETPARWRRRRRAIVLPARQRPTAARRRITSSPRREEAVP